MRRSLRLATTALLLALFYALPAAASRVIHVDFSAWSLETEFTEINGNNPPTANDVQLVKEAILWEMTRNFAPFDVYITEFEPNAGARSLVRFVAGPASVLGASGTNSGDCSDCTGIDSWDGFATISEVYVDSFAALNALQGSDATTARVARSLAHAAAHEVGHNLGLTHCHSCDDFFSANVGTADATCFGASADQNVTSHVMASGASAGLTNEQRATVDDFFSIHSSRRVLFSNVQPRGHWGRLRDIDDDGDDDLTYACVQDFDVVEWRNSDSDGVDEFEPETLFHDDAGKATDIFMHGDVTGNGNADLVIGKQISATTIKWRVRESSGTSFGSSSVWRSDGGDVGDVFRLGDVNGDGLLDLIAGHPVDPAAIFGWRWEVYLSNGSGFDAPSAIILSLATELVTDWLVADATGDGQDDLIAVHRTDPETNVRIFASTGTSFNHQDGTNFHPVFESIEYLHAGDTNGDGFADMIFGDVVDDTTVDWYVAVRNPACIPGLIDCFFSMTAWRLDGSSAGDETHVGDGNDDGLIDLFYGRAVGLDSLITPPDRDPIKWRARLSSGSDFGTPSVWAEDAASDGWLVP